MSDSTSGTAAAPAKIFLAVPNYGTLCAETSASLVTAILTSYAPDSTYQIGQIDLKHSSALTYNFNLLWCKALSMRKTHGITHFVMLHSDVHAGVGWIKTLLEELTKHQAGVVSCVIPIKDMRGVTTTAFAKPGSLDVLRRLTVREARRLPKTFTAADAGEPDKQLLINTGCWICDLRQPWVDRFPGFMIGNGLHEDEQSGEVIARFYPEDWMFGKWLADNNVKTMATTAVSISHFGTHAFNNNEDWGLETDPSDGPVAPMAPAAPQKESDERIAALEKKFMEKNKGPAEPAAKVVSLAPRKELSREIVAVRYAESIAWVHGWLDELVVKHGPNLTYRIYDKGPGGDTPNVGNLDWTYLHHICEQWDNLADWTVFTQANPFPHLRHQPLEAMLRFESLLLPTANAKFPFLVKCCEWGESGRLLWNSFPEPWKRRYETGSIKPARLSMREWFKEYIGVDIDALGKLEYHPGAIFGVSREVIQRRPKAFYERLRDSLAEGGHPSPETAHFCERSWPLVFGGA